MQRINDELMIDEMLPCNSTVNLIWHVNFSMVLTSSTLRNFHIRKCAQQIIREIVIKIIYDLLVLISTYFNHIIILKIILIVIKKF